MIIAQVPAHAAGKTASPSHHYFAPNTNIWIGLTSGFVFSSDQWHYVTVQRHLVTQPQTHDTDHPAKERHECHQMTRAGDDGLRPANGFSRAEHRAAPIDRTSPSDRSYGSPAPSPIDQRRIGASGLSGWAWRLSAFGGSTGLGSDGFFPRVSACGPWSGSGLSGSSLRSGFLYGLRVG